MKFRTVIDESAEDEITLICRERTDRIIFLEDMIKSAVGGDSTLLLEVGDMQYFVPKREILFFESGGAKVAAHTRDRMYYTDYKLFELERVMPPTFVRASKSAIVNTAAVYSIRKNLAGPSEVSFTGTDKRIYLSRNYYKPLMDKINETRL